MLACRLKQQFRARRALASVAWLVEESSHGLEGCGFDSWSGHVPGLQVQSLVPSQGTCGRQPVNVSLPSLPLSYPLFRVDELVLG